MSPLAPAEIFRKLRQQFLSSRSQFAMEILREPGSWRCLDRVYRNTPTGWIDRKLLGLKACEGTRERPRTYQTTLANAVGMSSDEPVRVLDLGSGPGSALIDLIASSPRTVLGTCVDHAADALEAGKALAQKRGVDPFISLVLDDVWRFVRRQPRQKFHVVGTHGLLDYLPADQGVRLLEAIRRPLEPHGLLLMTNMREHGNRLARSLMEFFGHWRLKYKDQPAVAGMLDAAGYVDVLTSLTPMGSYVLATARTPSDSLPQ